MRTRIYLGVLSTLPARCTFAVAVWACLLLALPAYGSGRDLRFVMSDLANYLITTADGEVDQSVAMGMDELWIAFIHENSGGYPRILQQLRRAQHAGNFRITYGLGTLDIHCFGETPYVYPYIDVSTSYDPRQYPAGDFYENWNTAPPIAGSITGQDGVDQSVQMPMRTALVGRDIAGNFLVAGVSWKFAPREWCFARSVYRFRFPLRLESDPSSLDPNDVVAVIEFVEEKQDEQPFRNLRTLASQPIRVRDVRQGEWRNLDVFLDYNLITPQLPPMNHYYLVDVRIRWLGTAGLSVGNIQQDQWDPTGNRTMLEAIDNGILSTGPGGRNIFNYLTDLNTQITLADPNLTNYMGGFFLIDEPTAPSHEAWNRVADAIRAHLRTLPGFDQLPIVTNFAGPTYPFGGQPNRFDKLFSVDSFLAFNLPVFSWDHYLFPPGQSIICPAAPPNPPNESDYQGTIDWVLSHWTLTAAHARSRGVPSQNFVTIQSDPGACGFIPVTEAELSAQVYLTLALGIDRIGFWHDGSAIDPAGNLTARGRYLRDLVTAVRQIKPTYDQLEFVETYSSPDLNGKLVAGLRDVNGKHANDLRIQIGQFAVNRDSYVLLVNRHTRTVLAGGRDDTLDLEVTFHLADSKPRTVVDAATNTVLGIVSRSQPSVRLRLDPGQGRLLGLTTPADTIVTAHGPCSDQNFERSPLRYDGRAGAFIDYFGSACHVIDLTYGPDNRLYILDEPAIQTPGGSCTTAFAVRRFNGLTGEFEDQIDEHADYVAYSNHLAQPNGFAFGPDGNLYISNGIGTGSIVLYQGPFGAAPGEFVTVFADLGNVVPTKLRFGLDGDLYVIGLGTGNVLQLQGPFGNAPGALVGEFVPASPTLGTPSDLAFGPDRNLYVASFDTGKVLRYAGPTSATPGQFLSEFATGLIRTAGIAFGPENDLFASGFSAGQTGVFRYDGNTGGSKGLFASVRTAQFGGIGPLLFSSSPLESADLGDYNGDRCVDRGDLSMLLAAISRRDTDSIYDLNGDGLVNIADSRKLTLLFTNPQGATCGAP